MKKIIIMLCFIFTTIPAISYDNNEFSNILGWEKKWNKIITTSTERYLTRLEKGYFSDLNNKNKESALTEVRQSLQSKLSWETMGQGFTQSIISHCDHETLNNMVRIYKKEINLASKRKTIVKQYSSCAKKGYRESLDKLKEVMMGSLSEVDPILEKYR